MGLAPYGNDSLLKAIPIEKWCREKDGDILCHSQIVYGECPPQRQKKNTIIDFWKAQSNGMRQKIKRWLGRVFVSTHERFYLKGVFAEPEIFPLLRLPMPSREVAHQLPDDYYASVAYAAQKIFEYVAYRLGKRLKDITGLEALCVAGGCGLNIDANKKFLDDVGFKKIFIQPAASDTGIALGCALWGWHVVLDQPRFWEMRDAALGRAYTEQEILVAIGRRKDEITVRKSPYIAEDTARLIAVGNIIGWFQGGSEYGPRALGHRSILCDARKPEMKDILNNKVKHRESWRPFAASVLREDMSAWFEIDNESPFMLLAALVAKDKRGKIPSVTHIDNTCRLQSLTKEANGRYYDLVLAFKKITDVPLVLNTSFNLAGDPIVETPDDALNCFLKTKMDYLVIENYIITKKSLDLLIK